MFLFSTPFFFPGTIKNINAFLLIFPIARCFIDVIKIRMYYSQEKQKTKKARKQSRIMAVALAWVA